MADRMVVIRYPDGREGAVLPEDFANPKLADNFKDAKILRFEDGSPWDGPTTPGGLARKEEREEAAEEEKPAPRRAARE